MFSNVSFSSGDSWTMWGYIWVTDPHVVHAWGLPGAQPYESHSLMGQP